MRSDEAGVTSKVEELVVAGVVSDQIESDLNHSLLLDKGSEIITD